MNASTAPRARTVVFRRYNPVMHRPSINEVLTTETPCPNCAYDLRGHSVVTRCPECGAEVEVGQAIAETIRWIDVRLLDLWSICVLQITGNVVAIPTIMAIRHGQYAALILGMMAMVCVSAATIWFLALTPGILLRYQRPFVHRIGADRMRRLIRWWCVDAALAALQPLAFTLLT